MSNEKIVEDVSEKTATFERKFKRFNISNDDFPMFSVPGILPQKTYIFWLLIFIVIFIASVNLILLIIMMNVLRITSRMESFEILPEEEIKFNGQSDMDYVQSNGHIQAFGDVPMEIVGDISVEMPNDHEGTRRKLKMSAKEISFLDMESFEVIDPATLLPVFAPTDRIHMPSKLTSLGVRNVTTNRIISLHDSNLTLRADTTVRLRGNEGLHIHGREAMLLADGDIYLNSVNGSIQMLADNVRIPIKRVSRVSMNTGSKLRYKLCACMPQGMLFKVLIYPHMEPHLACSYVDLSLGKNPCLKL